MLNGPTYTELVKLFWIKAFVFTEEDAVAEEESVVRSNQAMKGKNRVEMGLSEFIETEVRSNVLGLDMVITESMIRKLLQIPSGGLFFLGKKGESNHAKLIEKTLHEGRKS